MINVAVIGSGLMGAGIAQVAATAGHRVVLRDVTDEALERGLGGIRTSLDRFVAKEKLSAEDAAAALERITVTVDLEAAADADIVVEAVFEKIEIKHEVFRELDRICRDGAVLATNTSAIPVTQIAAVTQRPESVVGTHFFSPVPMMALCELVRGYKTSDETLAVARDFAESVGKTCVVVNRDVAGFVTTRLICALAMEHEWIPPTVNLTVADEACDLNFLPGSGRTMRVDHILSNSFGFGGINASLVLRRVN